MPLYSILTAKITDTVTFVDEGLEDDIEFDELNGDEEIDNVSTFSIKLLEAL